jgi:hypothetical protein
MIKRTKSVCQGFSMHIEFKHYIKKGADIKDVEGIFTGIAAHTKLDIKKDIILPQALEKTAKEFKNGKKIQLRYQHKNNVIFAENLLEVDFVNGDSLITKAKVEDEKRILHRKEFEDSVQLALNNSLYQSIGYYPLKYHYDTKTSIRYLEDIDIVEISLLANPANRMAKIMELKNDKLSLKEFIDNATNIDALEAILRKNKTIISNSETEFLLKKAFSFGLEEKFLKKSLDNQNNAIQDNQRDQYGSRPAKFEVQSDNKELLNLLNAIERMK